MGYSQPVFEEKQKIAIAKTGTKTQTNWNYYFNNGKKSDDGVKTAVINYDEKGNIKSTITYKMKRIHSQEKFEYDDEGRKIDYLKKQGEKIAYKKSYKYDSKDNIIEEFGFDGVSKFKNLYSYNSQNRLTEIQYFKSDQLIERRVFENSGDDANITVYDALKRIRSYASLKYDDNNNVVEEVNYDLKKKPIEKKIFLYNNDNKVISEVKYKNDEFAYKLKFMYNTKGNLITVDEENVHDGRYQKKNYKYDTQDNLIEMQWRSNPKDKYSIRKYSYNESGLCTEFETVYPATNFKVLTKMVYE